MSMFTTPKRADSASPYYPSDSPSSSSNAGANKTIIARGVKVEGDFMSQGDVVIEGEVHGKVATTGTLTVGSEAVIKADVTADEAIISGSVEGNLHVKKQAVLHASAKVKGDLTVERATIESGAVLEGKVQIGQTASASAPMRTNHRPVAKSVPAPAVEMAVAE